MSLHQHVAPFVTCDGKVAVVYTPPEYGVVTLYEYPFSTVPSVLLNIVRIPSYQLNPNTKFVNDDPKTVPTLPTMPKKRVIAGLDEKACN